MRYRGFTIVELLVVIVVIGILATLVSVAYGEFQVRARNAKTTLVIQAYKNALIQYAIDNRAYPTTTSACLGDDYPETGFLQMPIVGGVFAQTPAVVLLTQHLTMQ